MGRCGEHARRRFIIKISRALITERNYGERSGVGFRIADAEDVVDLAGADEGVNFGHLRFQLVAITLDQTTGNDQAGSFTISLQSGRFENCFNRFFLG